MPLFTIILIYHAHCSLDAHHSVLLQSHGADPAILSEDFDPYLDPGRKSPRQVASKEPAVQEALAALDMRYADVAKVSCYEADHASV